MSYTDTRPMAAVPISKSVTPDFIICLEDGKKLSHGHCGARQRLHDRIPDYGIPIHPRISSIAFST